MNPRTRHTSKNKNEVNIRNNGNKHRTWISSRKSRKIVNLSNTRNKHRSKEFHTCTDPRAPPAAAPLLHSLWHILQLLGRDVYVVHGYLDERPNMDYGPSVRFVTLSSNDTHVKIKSEKVYCTFWLSNDTDRVSNISMVHVSKAQVRGHFQRKMKPVNNITWINTYITCPVPNAIQLQLNDLQVSFSGTPCGNRTSPIPVLRIEKQMNFTAQVGKLTVVLVTLVIY